MMFEPDTRTLLNLIIEKKALSEHGVPEEGGLLPFEPLPLPNNYDQIIIIVKPTG